MKYEVRNFYNYGRKYRVIYNVYSECYEVFNGNIFLASCDNMREAIEEIDEHYSRITGKKVDLSYQ